MALVSGSENALGPAKTSWHGLSLAPTSATIPYHTVMHGVMVTAYVNIDLIEPRSQVNTFSIVNVRVFVSVFQFIRSTE